MKQAFTTLLQLKCFVMYWHALKLMANIHCINRYTKLFIKAAGCVLKKLQLTLGMTVKLPLKMKDHPCLNTPFTYSNFLTFKL